MTVGALQTIINMAETIEIDRRRVMGVQYTRSEVAKINETVTRNPWRFNITVPAMMSYETGRALIETLDYLDRRYPEQVSFSSSQGASSGLSWMFAYQGQLTPQQLSGITIESWTGTNMVLGNLPSVDPSTIMFKVGDLICPAEGAIPTTIVNYEIGVGSQGSIRRGTGSTVTVQVHRPNFSSFSNDYLGTILVGNDCTFYMFCNNMPTYKINPGGSTGLITWSGQFQFYEYTQQIL